MLFTVLISFFWVIAILSVLYIPRQSSPVFDADPSKDLLVCTCTQQAVLCTTTQDCTAKCVEGSDVDVQLSCETLDGGYKVCGSRTRMLQCNSRGKSGHIAAGIDPVFNWYNSRTRNWFPQKMPG